MNKYGNSQIYGLMWKWMLRTRNVGDVEFLRAVYPRSTTMAQVRSEIDRYLDELSRFTELQEAVAQYSKFIKNDYGTLMLDAQSWLPILYCLVRIQQPETLIETGCATGTTSALILYALAQNQHGHLHSIDLRFPTDWLTANNLPSGFLVPDALRSRWTLIEQDTKLALPTLLGQLGRVDLFYHDSDHSYVHQMWEYLSVWPYLKPRGILCSDDLVDSVAMLDMSRQAGGVLRITSRQRNFGMLVKG
jgi:predicted O-methyltransferase YrrM